MSTLRHSSYYHHITHGVLPSERQPRHDCETSDALQTFTNTSRYMSERTAADERVCGINTLNNDPYWRSMDVSWTHQQHATMYKHKARKNSTSTKGRCVNMSFLRRGNESGKRQECTRRDKTRRLSFMKSSCLRSRSVRCVCRRTAGCCSS